MVLNLETITKLASMIGQNFWSSPTPTLYNKEPNAYETLSEPLLQVLLMISVWATKVSEHGVLETMSAQILVVSILIQGF